MNGTHAAVGPNVPVTAKFWTESKCQAMVSAMPLDIADKLRDHGVHATAQRIAVLRAVSRQPHLTADEVAASVRADLGTISKQSVYDALGLLVASGLVRRIQPSGSPARYEDRVGDNHHHLVCRSCGGLVDVECAVGAAPCLVPADTGDFTVDEAEVVYWGLCPSCTARLNADHHLSPNALQERIP